MTSRARVFARSVATSTASPVHAGKGGKLVTLTPGQTFYEGPAEVHVVGRNASSTKPAKLLAILIKDKGAPALIPE